MLPGEDSALYQKLIDDVVAEVQPVSIIEKILVGDVVYLHWEIWRLRRLLTSLMRDKSLDALQRFLKTSLDYLYYSEEFERALTETLHDLVPKGQGEQYAKTLAHRAALNEVEAVEEVNKLLTAAELDLDDILNESMREKARQLTQAYARSESKAMAQVQKILLAEGTSLDLFTSKALANSDSQFAFLSIFERIGKLITSAESRRNSVLRDIDRHRTVLADALRHRSLEQIGGEIRLIKTDKDRGPHDQLAQD